MMRRSLLLCAALLLPLLTLRAAHVPNATVEKALYEYRLDEAWYALSGEQDAALVEYYKCRITFARLIGSENLMHAVTLKNLCDHAMNVFKALPETDPMRGVFIAETHLLRGIAAVQRGDMVNGGWEINSACTAIQKNKTAFPDEKANLKLTGLFKVVFGTLPRKWDWVAKFLCTSGEVNAGRQELEACAAAGGLMHWECDLILHFLTKSLLNHPDQSLAQLTQLRNRMGNSMMTDLIEAGNHLALRHNEEALRVLNGGDVWRRNASITFTPYWDFYQGLALAYAQRYDEALVRLVAFLDNYQGKTFRADAAFRKGMIQSLQGYTTAAAFTFTQIASMRPSNHEADEYASFMARVYSTNPPAGTDQTLYRARNLFDGGYYQQALNLLLPLVEGAATFTDDQATELHYRLGRIYQEMKNNALARIYFNSGLSHTPTHNLWMKVYSHYYMGRIYQDEKNYAEAEKFFKSALNFKGYLYEAGLQQKCRGALNSLPRR